MNEEELQERIRHAREKQAKLKQELIENFGGEENFNAHQSTFIHETAPHTADSALHPQPDSAIHCPKCGCTQLTANQKGFGLGKAAAGGLLLGPIGLLGGFLGSGKIVITCLKCGHQWKP